jgi:hypothetical protein
VVISNSAYHLLLYVSLGVAAASLIAGLVIAELATRRARVPVPIAEVADRRSPRGTARVLAIVCTVASGCAAAWIYWHARDLLYIRDSIDGASPERRVYLGAWSDLPFSTDSNCGRDPTWIVNESSRTLEIHKLAYGMSAHATLALHTTTCAEAVDYVGPNERPSDEAVQRISSPPLATGG